MIFNPRVDNLLNLVCLNLAMFRKKFGREKEAKFFFVYFLKVEEQRVRRESYCS